MTDYPLADLTEDDFLAGAQALLPRGRAWPRDLTATQAAYFRALAAIMQSAHADFANLVNVELDPAATDDLLDLWERAWGLPASCAPSGQTIDQRRAALKARISDDGGISRQHYIDLAAALGLTVTIDELRPFTCDSTVDDPIFDAVARFVWRMNVPEAADITLLRVGMSCGQRIRNWGDQELECVIRFHNRPSRTVLFAYTGV